MKENDRDRREREASMQEKEESIACLQQKLEMTEGELKGLKQNYEEMAQAIRYKDGTSGAGKAEQVLEHFRATLERNETKMEAYHRTIDALKLEIGTKNREIEELKLMLRNT